MCEDLGGAGVQHAEKCGRAEFKSLYAYRGNGSKQDQRHRKLEGYYGPARYNFYRLDLVPFLVPLCYRIARAYGIASTARRLKLP